MGEEKKKKKEKKNSSHLVSLADVGDDKQVPLMWDHILTPHLSTNRSLFSLSLLFCLTWLIWICGGDCGAEAMGGVWGNAKLTGEPWNLAMNAIFFFFAHHL